MDAQVLRGKRIIITGGASGMAAVVVRHYVAEGAAVVSMDINESDGTRIAAAANEAGPGSANFIRCDVADEASVTAAFDAAVKRLGRLDVLVNAAGIAPGSPAHTMTLADWEQVFAVNARGTFLTNRAAFPYLRDRGGKIINFASGAGAHGYPGKAHYSAAKAAVIGWTRSTAREWGRYGITVNALAPGIVTPMYRKTRSEMTPEQLAAHDAKLALDTPIDGKLGDADRDLAPFLVFLASDGARYMTGQLFAIDGGRLMVR